MSYSINRVSIPDSVQRQISQRRTDRIVVVRNPDKTLELGITDSEAPEDL